MQVRTWGNIPICYRPGGGNFFVYRDYNFPKVRLAICILISYNNSVGYKERCEK